MVENTDFLGRGWSFPPRFDGKFGRLEMVELEDEVRESLYIILSTIPGERVTNPAFGCNIYDLILEADQQGDQDFDGRSHPGSGKPL